MKESIEENKSGITLDICSVYPGCPMCTEVVLLREIERNRKVMIETASTQANPFGDHTGMMQAQFRNDINTIVHKLRFPEGSLLFSGAHPGPHCRKDESAENTRQKSENLVSQHARSVFSKTHFDTSMLYAGAPFSLTPEVVAKHVARRGKTAEFTATKAPGLAYEHFSNF